MNKEISFVYLDHRDFSDEAAKAWIKALTKLGVYVYPDSRCEDSDEYGFILSNQPLSKARRLNITRWE